MLKIGNIEFPEIPLILAPMENVTDPAFRKICKRFNADLMYTEFISSEGLIRDAFKSTRKLMVNDDERPIGIQIFGHDVNSMRKATTLAEAANPDLIDINFGCPVKKVVNKGAGAALLNDIPKMVEMTKAVVDSTSLPVTVKTRIGWNLPNLKIVEIALRLQDAGIKALTLHGRTRAQFYSGKADWTLIGEVKNNPGIHIPIFGNGDVDSSQQALEVLEKYHVDGLMIGRASIGNPWIFQHIREYLRNRMLPAIPGIAERIKICKEHLLLSVEMKGERTGILEMRKHYSGYFRGIFDFKNLKIALMQATEIDETLEVLAKIDVKYSAK